jgi:hypothetical protein
MVEVEVVLWNLAAHDRVPGTPQIQENSSEEGHLPTASSGNDDDIASGVHEWG